MEVELAKYLSKLNKNKEKINIWIKWKKFYFEYGK